MLKTERVQLRELESGEKRFDAFYYAGGGRAARRYLESSGVRLQRLDQAACAPFMGLRFGRFYVTDPSLGIPFIGPSEIQLPDTVGLPLVSRTRTENLEHLRVRSGWLLISRSGAIGNFAFVRSDMDGLIGSDDLIRIVPSKGGAPSGYLLAFLRSKLGLALIQRSTYGAVIQHIEPHHLADLPVPRLDPATEKRIHDNIVAAAELRVEANHHLDQARCRVYEATGLHPHNGAPVGRNLHGVRTFCVSSSTLGSRFEGRYHDVYVRDLARAIVANPTCGWLPLRDCADADLPDRGKWLNVQEGGVPLIGSGEMFAARPVPSRYVSPRLSPGVNNLIVRQNEILIARSGQIYSILGDVVLTGRSLAGKAVTEHAIRVRPRAGVVHPGFLFAFLSLSDYGYAQIVRTAYGTSVPSLSVTELGDIVVPMPAPAERDIIGKEVLNAVEQRDQANDLEDEAQAIFADALSAATMSGSFPSDLAGP